MSEHIVFVFDLVGSRTMPFTQRANVQLLLENCVDYLNEVFKDDLEREIDFTRGDAIQGFFHENATGQAKDCMVFLAVALWHVPARFSMAVGDWTYHSFRGVNAQDGEVFWNASNAMKMAKKNEWKVVIYDDPDGSKALADELHIAETTTLEKNKKMLEVFFDNSQPKLSRIRRSYWKDRENDIREIRKKLFEN